jgi:hypothetical protein
MCNKKNCNRHQTFHKDALVVSAFLYHGKERAGDTCAQGVVGCWNPYPMRTPTLTSKNPIAIKWNFMGILPIKLTVCTCVWDRDTQQQHTMNTRPQYPTRQTDRSLICIWYENLIAIWYAFRSVYGSNSDQKPPYSPIKFIFQQILIKFFLLLLIFLLF